MSPEREYIRDGKVTRMIAIELTDNRFVTCYYSIRYIFIEMLFFCCFLT
jgi:hypothetical protein